MLGAGESEIKMETIKVSKAELEVLYKMVRTQIDWQQGGCFGDGDIIDDKKGYNIAKKLLVKLSNNK